MYHGSACLTILFLFATMDEHGYPSGIYNNVPSNFDNETKHLTAFAKLLKTEKVYLVDYNDCTLASFKQNWHSSSNSPNQESILLQFMPTCPVDLKIIKFVQLTK